MGIVSHHTETSNSMKMFTCRLPLELIEALHGLAEEKGVKTSTLVREILSSGAKTTGDPNHKKRITPQKRNTQKRITNGEKQPRNTRTASVIHSNVIRFDENAENVLRLGQDPERNTQTASVIRGTAENVLREGVLHENVLRHDENIHQDAKQATGGVIRSVGTDCAVKEFNINYKDTAPVKLPPPNCPPPKAHLPSDKGSCGQQGKLAKAHQKKSEAQIRDYESAQKLEGFFRKMLISRLERRGIKVQRRLRKPTPAAKERWVDDLRKIISIDGCSESEIMDMLNWIENEGFWSKVILSPEKLRKHWERIALNRPESTSRGGPGDIPGASRREAALKELSKVLKGTSPVCSEFIETTIKTLIPETLGMVTSHNAKLESN